jgi:hypothetical protein
MTLVRNLEGEPIGNDLRRAYIALATAFLRHRGGGEGALNVADPCLLDSAVCATELPIDLRRTREQCDLIATDEERPIEIFNNLGHMFVLLQAIPVLGTAGLSIPRFCSPTQQAEHEGMRIADLEGEGWALEAFGGSNITNNGKLAKDLRTLSERAKQHQRTFLAFRSSAWPSTRKWNVGIGNAVKHRCSPAHGGPFSATSQGRLIERLNEVTVIEVSEIAIVQGS